MEILAKGSWRGDHGTLEITSPWKRDERRRSQADDICPCRLGNQRLISLLADGFVGLVEHNLADFPANRHEETGKRGACVCHRLISSQNPSLINNLTASSHRHALIKFKPYDWSTERFEVHRWVTCCRRPATNWVSMKKGVRAILDAAHSLKTLFCMFGWPHSSVCIMY